MRDKFHTYMRAYEKAQRAESSYERAMNEWLMYEEELIDSGLLDDFGRFYQTQHNKDVEEWNRLVSKRERMLKND